jgi:hypothetical protein
MVVIGGLGSVAGALLGALYLVGLPAIFGTTPTIQFVTSGIGLIAFILYLPGGLAELMHGAGDLIANAVAWLWARRRGPPRVDEGSAPDQTELGEAVTAVSGGPSSSVEPAR